MSEIQICHACESFDRVGGICRKNNLPVHENKYRIGCPDGKFPARGVPIKHVQLGTGRPVASVALDVLAERRTICEDCPIGGFEGWADPHRMVAKCRHCEACKKRGRASGLIQLTHFKCPRGHHD